LGISCGEKPTRHFEPGGFRLRFADQTGCAITVDFVKLILIDNEIAATNELARFSPKRPHYGEDRRGRHQREYAP
jgi:hypothetical protein